MRDEYIYSIYSGSLDMFGFCVNGGRCKRNGLLSSIDFVLPFGYFEAAHVSRLIEIIECGIMN